MSEKGFTLLEVVLAIAIISLALVPIALDMAGGLKIGAEGINMDKASYLAEGKMEELLMLDCNILADANGVKIMGEDLPWRVTVSPYDGDQDGNFDSDLKHISLQAGEIRLETLRFRGQ